MTIMWIAIGVAALVAVTLWFYWREKNQGEAVKQYVLETAALERQLALLNPRLARGVSLEPDEQAWLEKMLFERRITSDPTKWARPDLGYDAISGLPVEALASIIECGGSEELLKMKSEQVRVEKMQRMVNDIGMPATQEQINKWWTEHSGGAKTARQDPVLPSQRIYHAAVVRNPPSSKDHDAAVKFERGHQRGQEDGQKIADAVDGMMEWHVKPWADNMIDTFTKGVTVKVIFCDDDPASEAQSSLAGFNQAVDGHLETIRPDVRAKLSACEQLCRESNALDAFELLLKRRFESLRNNLTVKAIEIAGCVVSARKEEMGLGVEEGESLTKGRRILKEVRAMPVSLTEDERKFLKTCAEALE